MTANASLAASTAFVGRCPNETPTCMRILSPIEVLIIALDVPALLFHVSVLYFVLRQIVGKKQAFSSAFYRLFAAMGVVEVVHMIDTYVLLRFPNYGLFLDVWETSVVLSRSGYLITGYCVYFQFFAHTAIAANRFTVFAFPEMYKKVWTKRNATYILCVNALLPLIFLSFRLPAATEYFYVGANAMASRYKDPSIRFYAALVSAGLSLSTSIASAIFEILAVVANRRHAKLYTASSEQRHDVRLLFCTLMMLIAQCLYTSYQCTIVYATVTANFQLLGLAQRQVVWILDILCLSGSFCLFLTSSSVRRSYLKFYGLLSSNGPMIVTTNSHTNSSTLPAANANAPSQNARR